MGEEREMIRSKRVISLVLAITLCFAPVGVLAASDNTQGALQGENTAEGVVEVTVTPTVEVTPEATPEVTPEATPEVTPEVTPKAAPRTVPKATPEVTAEVEEPTLVSESAPTQRGWIHDGSGWRYSPDAIGWAAGWVAVDGKQYYFDPDRNYYMKTGWLELPDEGEGKGGIYYFERLASSPQLGRGAMETGWTYIEQDGDGNWFYFTPSGEDRGKMRLGWQTINNQTYFFHERDGLGNKGRMVVGWHQVGGNFFYFDLTTDTRRAGHLITGDSNGWQKIDGSWYLLNKSGGNGQRGRARVDWQKVGGRWYYLSPTGGLGTRGKMLTGLHKIGNRYWFLETANNGNDGRMVTGWRKVNGSWYYFTPGDSGAARTGWQKISGKWYYLDPKDAKMRTGWQKLNGKWYYLTPGDSGAMRTGWQRINGTWYYLMPGDNGSMVTGWRQIGGLWYFFKGGDSGALVQDVSTRADVKGRPYMATINRRRNVVTIYARDAAGRFSIPVKTMACSVGKASTPTPTGTFRAGQKYRWKELIGPSWGQYATRITGGILFHSVAGYRSGTPYNISAGEYNKLGGPASAGCVRLNVRDAKWIYDNCQSGMTVSISDTAYVPFDKPATIKIPASQNWDPTDPAVRR